MAFPRRRLHGRTHPPRSRNPHRIHVRRNPWHCQTI
nr:MAG TPA: hypothetical protein [Caudoviricetes sp.]